MTHHCICAVKHKEAKRNCPDYNLCVRLGVQAEPARAKPAPCFIFDLDDTLADNGHRMEYMQKGDWDTYFARCVDDPLISHVAAVATSLARCGFPIAIITGRSESVREETEHWLRKHSIFFARLYMRKNGDVRANSVMKLEALAELRASGYEPLMAFDDQPQTCKMWRDAGVPCAQVKGAEDFIEYKQRA
jgi:phosphoglycolate phosphatase-like HAD superfamily hydrolase